MTIQEVQAIFPTATAETWHQHTNGGGWVANTSIVPESIRVPENTIVGYGCKLGNDCTLGYDCTLGNDCKLGNDCTLGDDCTLGNDCKLGNDCTLGDGCKRSIYMQPSGGHPITAASDRYIQIGCQRHAIEWWLEHYAEVGAENGYTTAQIAEYGALLKSVAAWVEAL